uniref:Photosynthetic NDH subunit of lumenal location 2, chloroplastic n=1 Tax=Oryza punctata TaxID=4537 RepID=A0A0E0K1I9_ORYPU
MATLAKHLILCSTATSSSSSSSASSRCRGSASQADAASAAEKKQRAPQSATRRLAVAASTALAATAALSARRPAAPPPAMAAEAAAVPSPPPGPGTVPRWGTRSYVRERFFEPGLTAEEAAARIRQTAEGMRTLRPMLETMSWKYVLFYVRLKSKYLDLDLTTAMAGVPEARRSDYVRVANELVDNMTEFDRFVRTPKVYESYLYYEKTLKSLDDVRLASASAERKTRATSTTAAAKEPTSDAVMRSQKEVNCWQIPNQLAHALPLRARYTIAAAADALAVSSASITCMPFIFSTQTRT